MPTQSNDGRRSPDRDVDDRSGRDAVRGRDEDRGWSARDPETGFGAPSPYGGDRSYATSDDDRFGRGGGGASRGFGRADENRRLGPAVGRMPAYGVGGGSFDERLVGHRGQGPRNYVRSDERLREILCEVLADDDRIDASQIEVEVHSGDVTLSGTVPDRRMKRLAEDVLENLPGVEEVHNHIRGPALFGRGGGSRSIEDSVDQLNSLLRGEISAVETYRMALDKLDRGSHARGELETCIRSHEERVNVLRDKVRQLGGTPATSSGPWGVFARLVEGGARALGDKAAIAALEEGEDHGLKDYRSALDKLDPEGRQLVLSRLLPAQEDTHARMSAFKRRLGSSGAAS